MTDPDGDIPAPDLATEAAQAAAADVLGENPPAQDTLQRRVDKVQDLVATIVQRLTQLDQRVTELATAVERAVEEEQRRHTQPAPWVWYPPPAFSSDPRTTVAAFVEFYNRTYVGGDDGRARAIPDCWPQHPGLAMEIANLADSWRAANIGPSAHPRDAQYWHQQWRPGVIDRMCRDWLHPHCLDGQHQTAGAPPQVDRFTAAEAASARGEPEAD